MKKQWRRPGAVIPLASVANLRDLGGWRACDGRMVRHGLLFRSAELDKLADDDLEAFERLGIRTIYDLRTEDERAAQPDRVPDGIEHVVIDVLADSSSSAAAQVVDVPSDPEQAEELLGGGRAVQLFLAGYREAVHLPSALKGYRRLFSDIARPEHRPALFHCTTGKDRTGWAAAALLMLLGVSDGAAHRQEARQRADRPRQQRSRGAARRGRLRAPGGQDHTPARHMIRYRVSFRSAQPFHDPSLHDRGRRRMGRARH